MQTNRITTAAVVAFAAMTACSGASGTPVTAYTFPNGMGGQLTQPSFAAVEGNLFKVGPLPITVTALAYEYVQPGESPGITAIFDATTGADLESATLTTSSLLQNGYYWQSITPLHLIVNHEYYIGSLHPSGPAGDYIWNTREAQVPAAITDLGTWFKVSSTIDGGSWQFGGGTSQYGNYEIRHYVGNFQFVSALGVVGNFVPPRS